MPLVRCAGLLDEFNQQHMVRFSAGASLLQLVHLEIRALAAAGFFERMFDQERRLGPQ